MQLAERLGNIAQMKADEEQMIETEQNFMYCFLCVLFKKKFLLFPPFMMFDTIIMITGFCHEVFIDVVEYNNNNNNNRDDIYGAADHKRMSKSHSFSPVLMFYVFAYLC